MVSIRNILCPVDYSVCSNEAMRYAAHFSKRESAKLYVMHVIDIRQFGHESPLDFEVPRPTSETIEKIKKDLVENAILQETAKNVEVEVLVAVGIPAQEILRAAGEKGVDMIIMGTHGRTGVAHVVVGSVAENVVRKAPCPVLTIRHP